MEEVLKMAGGVA